MRLTGLSRLSPCAGDRIKVTGFSAYSWITLTLPSPFGTESNHAEDNETLELLVG
jgi:hypothetical protein